MPIHASAYQCVRYELRHLAKCSSFDKQFCTCVLLLVCCLTRTTSLHQTQMHDTEGTQQRRATESWILSKQLTLICIYVNIVSSEAYPSLPCSWTELPCERREPASAKQCDVEKLYFYIERREHDDVLLGALYAHTYIYIVHTAMSVVCLLDCLFALSLNYNGQQAECECWPTVRERTCVVTQAFGIFSKAMLTSFCALPRWVSCYSLPTSQNDVQKRTPQTSDGSSITVFLWCERCNDESVYIIISLYVCGMCGV